MQRKRDASKENGQRRSGLAVVDRGDYSILETLELLARTKGLPGSERQAEMKKFLATHPGDAQRLYLGRGRDRSVGLTLKDTEGRDRIVLRVAADGTPGLQFLDAGRKLSAVKAGSGGRLLPNRRATCGNRPRAAMELCR